MRWCRSARFGRSAQVAALLAALAGCAPYGSPRAALLARDTAQPDAPPLRTVTSFTEALYCLDGLLQAAGRRPVVLSSSEIQDFTRQLHVSADDMLVNAISQINRRSGAYIFLDQARTRKDGMVDLVIAVPGREPRPQFYIRGAISQLDEGTRSASVGLEVDGSSASEDVPRGASLGHARSAAVVSVDLHLVAYPSRRVVAGASVANSMVVSGRSFSGGFSGVVDLSPIDLRLRVSRVESLGQAVRNLIELGVIELLGKHSGVAYETCLLPALGPPRQQTGPSPAPLPPQTVVIAPDTTTDAAVAGSTDRKAVQALQAALILAGYLTTPTTGALDSATQAALQRFQRNEGLLPTGQLDADTRQRLLSRL